MNGKREKSREKKEIKKSQVEKFKTENLQKTFEENERKKSSLSVWLTPVEVLVNGGVVLSPFS